MKYVIESNTLINMTFEAYILRSFWDYNLMISFKRFLMNPLIAKYFSKLCSSL
jgi:hypothetical protein